MLGDLTAISILTIAFVTILHRVCHCICTIFAQFCRVLQRWLTKKRRREKERKRRRKKQRPKGVFLGRRCWEAKVISGNRYRHKRHFVWRSRHNRCVIDEFCMRRSILLPEPRLGMKSSICSQILACDLMRGGGKSPSLLEGLSKLLESIPDPPQEEQDLYDDLCQLVESRPKNLLQQLKSLVGRHTKAAAKPARQVVLRDDSAPKHAKEHEWHGAQKSWKQVAAENEWHVVQKRRARNTPSNGATWHYRRDDWVAPSGKPIGFISDATHLGNEMDTSEGIAWLLATSDASDAEDAVRMIRGNASGDHGLALIFDGRGDQLGDWAKDAQLVRIPGSVNGKLQVKRVWLLCVGPFYPTLRTRSTEPLKVTKPPPTKAEQKVNTVVLRVAVQRQYAQDNWQTVSRKPMQFFRAWACEQGGVKSFQIIDTWNFREEGLNRITGYVRIDSASTARTLFHASGQPGGTTRFFVDIIGEKSLITTATKVVWTEWYETENYDAYLQRVLAEASHGLALGDKQLGIKVATNDSRWRPPTCLWRLKGAPSHWNLPDIQELAGELGFKGTDIVAKHRIRGGSAWLFRAQRQDELTVLQQLVDWGDQEASEIEVTKEANRRGSKEISKRISSERVVDFSFKAFIERSGGTSSKPSSPSPPATTHDSRKRQFREKGADDDEILEEAQHWMPQGRIIPNPGEGNCLWHALAAAASSDVKKRSHRQMRAWTINTMQDNDDLKATWTAQGCPDDRGQPSTMTWKQYLEDQGNLGQWSGALEAAACAVAMNWRLWICTDTGHLHLLNKEATGDFTVLKCQVGAGHYELIQEVQEEELRARLRALNEQGSQPPNVLLRAGVARALSDFATPSQGRKANKRALTDFASPASARVTQLGINQAQTECHPTTCDTDIETDLWVSEKPAKKRHPKFGISLYQDPAGGYTWKCDLCPFVSHSDNAVVVRSQKSHHLRTCHPVSGGRSRLSQFSRLKPVKQMQSIGWKCPLCKLGLSQIDVDSLSNMALWSAKQRHRREAHPRVQQERWRQLNSRRKNLKTIAYRQKCRISQLNRFTSKRVAVPSGFEHFSRPTIQHTKNGQIRYKLYSSIRCQTCLQCLKSPRCATTHVCKGTSAKRRPKRCLASLAKAERQWIAHPQGIPVDRLQHLFHIARAAFQGLPLPKP